MSYSSLDALAHDLLWVPDGHGSYVPMSTPAANALAPRIMRMLADAWDQGYEEAIDRYGTSIPWGGTTTEDNPYRLACADPGGAA